MGNVILAKTAGFCFGVKRAVDMAYSLTGEENVYTYGPIIHNETVVDDLAARGVHVISTLQEAETAPRGTIIIRSHGISREEMESLSQMGHRIVDATCPFVKKIHRIVDERSAAGEQILMPTDENIGKFKGTVLLSGVAAFIWEKMQAPVSRDDLLTAILDEYEVEESVAAKDLDNLLTKLDEYGVIEKD